MFIDDAGQLRVWIGNQHRADGHHQFRHGVNQALWDGSRVMSRKGQDSHSWMSTGMPRADRSGGHGPTRGGEQDHCQKNQWHTARHAGDTMVLNAAVFGLHRYSVPIVQASTL